MTLTKEIVDFIMENVKFGNAEMEAKLYFVYYISYFFYASSFGALKNFMICVNENL